jgi:hypothetical protein
VRDKFNVPRQVVFKVPICFIIGDVEGHDLLCGRYSSHQMKQLGIYNSLTDKRLLVYITHDLRLEQMAVCRGSHQGDTAIL